MKQQVFPLTLVIPDREVTLVSISGGRNLRARLKDMGLREGLKFKVLHSYNLGPCVIRIGNTRLVLGHGMAQKMMVREG